MVPIALSLWWKILAGAGKEQSHFLYDQEADGRTKRPGLHIPLKGISPVMPLPPTKTDLLKILPSSDDTMLDPTFNTRAFGRR